MADSLLLTTVLVADDHPIVREGMVAFIDRQTDMRVVAEASNGHEAVERFMATLPDIGILDLRMPMVDGIEAILTIRRKVPGAHLVVLTSYETEEDIYRALRAGAQGYLFKCCPKEELLECIRAVSSGRSWIPPEVGAKLAKRVVTPDLTRREIDILGALSIGKSNKEIGTLFDISEATVKVHVTHILEKLHVSSRTEAINVAAGRGLVRLGNQLPYCH
jgi:two-component system NarL family response regulator